MKIGIKYCGGCNPRYDRANAVLKLKKHIGEGYNIETAKIGVIYDLVVIMCGCSSDCANLKNLEAKYEKICITSESDITKVSNIIDKIKDL